MSGSPCVVCGRWFRAKHELSAHQKSICAPTLRSHTFGSQARHPAPGHDVARFTNMPVIPRHPVFFEHMQRENVQGNSSVVTHGGVGDSPAVRRYSVPHETRSLQSNLTRRYSGPSILCEDREVDVVWSSMMNQESPNYRMDQVARGEILPLAKIVPQRSGPCAK